MKYDRQKGGVMSNWWWTVDRPILFAIAAIISIGVIMVTTASPAVAERIGLDSFFFVKRQLLYLSLASMVIIAVSFLSPQTIKRLAFLGFAVGTVLLIMVLFSGIEIKGARRWLHIAGLSLQPSEFMKPCFIVLTAWVLAKHVPTNPIHAYKLSAILYVVLVTLLILQPDIGMTIVVSLVWGGQLFIAGLPFLFIMVITLIGILGIISAYSFLPHVAERINKFLGENVSYQVQKSLEAFSNGGIFGTGPGEGVVKQHLPDSHTDFIFAVAGEELGILACLIILGLFAFIVIRALIRAYQEEDLFLVYAVAGLSMQFGLQAIVNMGVTLNLLPTKGMTLPFISYGGSSLVAIALGVGMLVSLTKKRFGETIKS